MNGIRKYVYAAVLTLSALNFAPTPASAQDEGGSFTLPHEVHWQDAVVPAGDYRFTVEAVGPSELLRLRRISGAPASFMLMVNAADVMQGGEAAKLLIKSENGVRYVSLMSLPEFELSMHFAPPRGQGEIAEVRTTSASSAASR